MSAAAAVIDLDAFRRRKATRAAQATPPTFAGAFTSAHAYYGYVPVCLMWIPVWRVA